MGDIPRDNSSTLSSIPGTPGIKPAMPASSAQGTKPRHFTVTVGRKPSKAAYYVSDVGEVSELLKKLAQKAIVSSFSRFSSMPNFQENIKMTSMVGGLAGLADVD